MRINSVLSLNRIKASTAPNKLAVSGLNTLKIDTVSFSSKNITEEDAEEQMSCDTANFLFNSLGEMVEDFLEAQKAVNIVPSKRDALIYKRVGRAISDAKEFTTKFPQFDFDDVCQNLIMFLIECTDKRLDGELEYSPFTLYATKKKHYFNLLLNRDAKFVPLSEEHENLMKQQDAEWYARKLKSIELAKIFDKLLSALDPLERQILEEYFGLNGGDSKTTRKIARDRNFSKDRVMRILNQGLKKLRHPYYSFDTTDFHYD